VFRVSIRVMYLFRQGFGTQIPGLLFASAFCSNFWDSKIFYISRNSYNVFKYIPVRLWSPFHLPGGSGQLDHPDPVEKSVWQDGSRDSVVTIFRPRDAGKS